nr:myotubularin-related protein 3 [Onthophagus taurus]XP_022920446.1 myotubularin-related protein 3 [Onthophagus taurus]XP_022920447.1 myotubularin-related protein 3 [Onthophagus taurus]
MDTTDQPNSICHVRPIQMYPMPPTTADKIDLPFVLLAGESVTRTGTSVDGLLVLTSYRLYVQLCDTQHHIPLGLIESVEQRELFHLHISCKDARSFRCTFDNNETCLDWNSQLIKASLPPRQLEELFAFYHYVWSREKGGDDVAQKIDAQKALLYDEAAFKNEFTRLKFDQNGTWRISSVNASYKLCPSYPPSLVVPSCISDVTLETVAKFRSSRRIPAVVWRHTRNGAVIARCSQPEVGWLGWRSAEDEELLKALADGCSYDIGDLPIDKEYCISHSPGSVHSEDSGQTQSVADILERKKVLIMDARSYTTAVANRARGGGCECPEYYPCCEIQFMNLANIHSIRKSFHALRQLCTSSADQPNWYSLLEGTRWLQHMSGVIRAAVTLVSAIEREARPVLVHCSDGWDRTPQIVALGQLLLDPYYRTVNGFRILVEKEWLSFGHKFADRCGHATGSEDQNERCPVFLQWLDCVHQLLRQFPCSFEFSHAYLVKLAQHTYSNLFGTFLCNTKQERVDRVNENTFSVWGFLNAPCFRNHLYAPIKLDSPQVLWPQCNVRDLHLWTEVYLGSLERRSTVESGCSSCPGPPEDPISQHMTKTRSYGDLPNASENSQTHFRRSSDSGITADSIKINSLTVEDKPPQADDSNPPINGCDDIMTPPNDFLSGELDEIDCKSDCLYKDERSANEEDCEDDPFPTLVNGGALAGDNESGVHAMGDATAKIKTENNDNEAVFESICLKTPPSEQLSGELGSDVIRCSVARGASSTTLTPSVGDDVDSDTECTEPSEGRSENTVVCDVRSVDNVLDSVETSTETLVSEIVVNSLPKPINGIEKITNVDTYNGNGSDSCKTCTQNRRVINCKHSYSGSTSGKTSQYSTPPLYSRTPSANGWDNTLTYLNQQQKYYQCSSLGDDGLVPLRSDLQDRLWQIIEEHRMKEEELRRELQTYRRALIKQVCHKCNQNDADKNDETSSVVDSVCSTGEGPTSAVESLQSDMSWEAVEEGAAFVENAPPILWVPDYAVTRCTGCQVIFWLGRRKHHCRKCGRIFCADCSENSTPLPSENLYDPVRVCTSCYSKLRRDCTEVIPDQCKQRASQATNNNPQIAASSN